MGISDANFLSGKYAFERNGANGAVVNSGQINIRNGGYLALLAPEVRNTGSIVADLGSVALASGNAATVSLDSNGDMSVVVDQPLDVAVPGSTAVTNEGTIQANGGKVLLTARSLDGILDQAVNNSGVIRANSMVNRNGTVELVADGSVFLNDGSVIDVAGASANGGRRVNIKARDSIFFSGTVDAGSAGNVTLEAVRGNIIEGTSSTLIADGAELLALGDITLSNTMVLNTIAVNSQGYVALINTNPSGLKVGTVGRTSGITASFLSLTERVGDIHVDQAVNGAMSVVITAETGDLFLNADIGVAVDVVALTGMHDVLQTAGAITSPNIVEIQAGHAIVQSGTGVIQAPGLGMSATTGISATNGNKTTVLTASTDAGDILFNNLTGMTLDGVSTDDGSIRITAGDEIEVHSVTAGKILSARNDISLTAATSDIWVGSINAGSTGNVRLEASAGNILEIPSTELMARGLELISAGSVTLSNMFVSAVAAKVAGDLNLTNTNINGLRVGAVGGTRGITADSLALAETAGNLMVDNAIRVRTETALTSPQDIVIAADMNNAPSGSIYVEAGHDVLQKAGTIASSDTTLLAGNAIRQSGKALIMSPILFLGASSGINMGNGNDAGFLTATTTAGDIVFNDTYGLTLADVSTQNGAVTVSAKGDLNVMNVKAKNGTATLKSASGAIIDGNGAANNITATSLNATAQKGIDLNTDVTNLTALNTGAGNINLNEANGANVISVVASNGRSTVTTKTGKLNFAKVITKDQGRSKRQRD
jgi:hypothetical protein